MFTRAHYIKIAAVLNKKYQERFDENIEELIEDFADMFEQDISRFDRERFVKAAKEGV